MSSEFRLRLRLRKLWLPMSILVVAGVLRYLSMAHYSQRTDACILFNDRCPLDQPVPTVRGYAAPGYEPLATALQQLVHKGYTLGASVAVYLEDKPVVSLTAGTAELLNGSRREWTEDQIVNVFSVGKALEPMVVALLVERGHLRYDQKIADIWPEFGCNGKENLTLADLNRHETNLAWFNDSIPAEVLDLNTPKMSQRLAAMQNNNVGGTPRRDYHAVLRGMLLSEIVQRADPQKRSLGRILEEEIAKPLGISRQQLRATGVPKGQDDPVWPSIARIMPLSLVRSVVIPLFFGPLGLARPFGGLSGMIMPKFLEPGSAVLLSTMYSLKIEPLFTSPENFAFNKLEVLSKELTSANTLSNAKTVAKLLAMLVNGGQLDGVRVLDAKVLDQALSEPRSATNSGFMDHSYFTLGGWGALDEHQLHMGRQPAYANISQGDMIFGWHGAGGAQAWFSRRHKFSFCFVPNSMFSNDYFAFEELAEMLTVTAQQAEKATAAREAAEQKAAAEAAAAAKKRAEQEAAAAAKRRAEEEAAAAAKKRAEEEAAAAKKRAEQEARAAEKRAAEAAAAKQRAAEAAAAKTRAQEKPAEQTGAGKRQD